MRYDAIDQVLYVDSKVDDFKSFLSIEYGFGLVEMKDGKINLEIEFGEIPVKEVVISNK